MNRIAIVQARMGSTRLAGKVMKTIEDHTVLGHVINRLKAVDSIDSIVIATTTNAEDIVIVEEAMKYNVMAYKGSSDHVLSRYYEAANEYQADVIIRVTSDCPLIDPEVTNETIKLWEESKVDYVSNKRITTFPRGLDTEVFSFDALKKSYDNAYNDIHTEHVTPYIYLHEDKFSIKDYIWKQDYSKYRWTLDTPEDYELITQIYKHLYVKNEIFSWLDGIKLMEEHPDLFEINREIKQKELGE